MPTRYCTLRVTCEAVGQKVRKHRKDGQALNQLPRTRTFNLNKNQLKRFEREGYLVIKNVLDPIEVIEPLFAEYAVVLDRLANELFDRGEISSTYRNLGFGDRMIRIYQESGRDHSRYFDPSLPTGGVTTNTPFWAGPAAFRILTDENILDVVESLIGPEITSNPTQHVRIKPPENLLPKSRDVLVRANPWHQDNGVVHPDADKTNMITVWISLTEATVDRGCLHLIPGSHKKALRTHCIHPELAIPNELLELDRVAAVPTKPGDIIVMHKHTCHCSLPNVSKNLRWSLDLRYNPTGQPTGRAGFPDFIARSRSKPKNELRDPVAWSQMWHKARTQLTINPNPIGHHHGVRWKGTESVCA